MALPVNEKELIEGSFVEWERLEFKKGFHPEKVLQTICAFANDINNWGGGYIIIGIEEDSGRPILPPGGLKKNQIDSIQKKIIELSYKIQPNFTPIIQPYDYKGKHVLIVWVPGGDTRPYKAPDSLSKKKTGFSYYIRKGSTTVKARGEDERRLLELSAKVPFDDRISHNAEIENLDKGIITDFLKKVNSSLYEEIDKLDFVDLCERMKIVRGPKEYKKPVNAGLLLFNKTPEEYFKGAIIEIIIYHDEVGDSLTEKPFKGPLHIHLKNALNYIQQNIIAEEVRKIKGQAEAERFYNYPYEAIEESLANAVYHRSYELRSTIEVNIRDDCIEILSFPGPVPPINNDTLKKPRIVARNYRNRRIGDFLKELHLTEGRSTGIPKIRKAMKQNGSPEPVFETDEERNYFLTVLPIHEGAKAAPSRHQAEPAATQVPRKHHASTTQVKDILTYCLKPRGRGAIQKKVGLKNREHFRKNILNPLLKDNLIKMTDPDNPTNPKQKYVTTEKGKKLI